MKKVRLDLYGTAPNQNSPLSTEEFTDPEAFLMAVYAEAGFCEYFDEEGTDIIHLQDALAHLGVEDPQNFLDEFKARESGNQ